MPNIKQHEQSSAEHLTKDGQPDHRYKENRDDSNTERRSNNNRDDDYEPNQSGKSSSEHLTKDGQPDHRYKENRDDEDQQKQSDNNSSGQSKKQNRDDEGQQKQSGNSSSEQSKRENRDKSQSGEEHQVDLADIHVKADGTADMRYKDSREAVAQGLISQDDVVEEAQNE